MIDTESCLLRLARCSAIAVGVPVYGEAEYLVAQSARALGDAGLEQAIRCVIRARAAMEKHDKAPYQCESTRGAEGAMECREELDAALAALAGKEAGK